MNNSLDSNVSEQNSSQEAFEPLSPTTTIPKGSIVKRVSRPNKLASHESDPEIRTVNDQKKERKIRKETPLPKTTIFVLSVIVFSEPMNSTILFPFVYFMVRDFGVSDDDKEIGRYAGLIASSFFFAQFCFAMFWGSLSDRVGRRPILLLGLLGNIVTCLLFGLSKSLVWAIATRATCGMLNGNVGVAKSPMTGGYLSNPVDRFPGIFGGCLFLKQFPYFLPCAVAAFIGLTGFIVGFFMLPETRHHKILSDPERKPFLPSNKKLYGAVIPRNEINDNNSSKIITDDVCSVTSNDIDKDSTNGKKIIVKNSISKITYYTIASYAVICFQTILLDEVYPIYTVTPIKDGGLGFHSNDLALTLAFSGALHLFCQFLVYPYLRNKWDTLKMFRIAFIAFIPCYCTFPLISLLQRKLSESETTSIVGTTIIWPLLFLNLIFRVFLNVIVYTTIMILINNSAKSNVLGAVNGLSQTFASLSRSFGPALGGFLWSWSLKNNLGFPFNYFFVFILISTVAFIGFIQSFHLPDELGYMEEISVGIGE
ncbi:MFS general substrate transporter [Gigaspora margarita]|uniref:MFS general substrate transporter n=1 Tax=Gigaspora margarita TaxID=4874 RepID=A0A8H3X0P3_GIGMA|nr:MFS general substrate transporter [Gigaspora margarita]